MTQLSREEFLAHIGYIREDIAGVNDRLDNLNGQTRRHGEKIAVLEDARAEAKKAGIVSGATAGTFVGGVVWAIWQFVHGSK